MLVPEWTERDLPAERRERLRNEGEKRKDRESEKLRRLRARVDRLRSAQIQQGRVVLERSENNSHYIHFQC